MKNGFFQKLILVVLAGALTAGLYEFYQTFVVSSMAPLENGYGGSRKAVPTETPRRF